MAHGGTQVATVALLALVGSLGAACAGGDQDTVGASPAAESAGSPAAGPATPRSPSASTTDADETAPAGMATPATTSGQMSIESFPTPRRLGAGWAYAVDPGDVEEGYAGNGTPALARDPAEVAQTAVPLGCARDEPMPTPKHALEVDYTRDGSTVIAVRAAFREAAEADRFQEARTANLRSCEGRSGSPAIGPLVSDVEQLGAGVLLSRRTPQSDPWTELAVPVGDTVVLVALQGTDLTADQARRLAAAFTG